MTDAVADTIESLQQRIRLLRQRLYDAEREIEELGHANDRQKRDLEDLRRHALMVDDYERARGRRRNPRAPPALAEGALASARRPHSPSSI